MSESVLPPSDFFSNPDPLETSAPPEGANPSAISATAAPVQLGGVEQTWQTVAAAPGTTAQVVVSGENTRLNLNTGSAFVTAVGSGLIIESIQLVNSSNQIVPDAGKAIKLGSETVAFTPTPINANSIVSGNTVAQTETIAQAAGGNVTPFVFYVHGGTGNDSIEGSAFSDFIRGGAGNDILNGYGGSDLIRGGAGSDTFTLGSDVGVSDTLYYTVDQVTNGDRDVVTDFQSGLDKVQVQVGVSYSLSSDAKTIFFSAPGARSALFNQAGIFSQSDISYVG
jgi:Ca2+-binding RTX toxin-like protein